MYLPSVDGSNFAVRKPAERSLAGVEALAFPVGCVARYVLELIGVVALGQIQHLAFAVSGNKGALSDYSNRDVFLHKMLLPILKPTAFAFKQPKP